jgi:hypothetical protein
LLKEESPAAGLMAAVTTAATRNPTTIGRTSR